MCRYESAGNIRMNNLSDCCFEEPQLIRVPGNCLNRSKCLDGHGGCVKETQRGMEYGRGALELCRGWCGGA